MMRVQVIHAWPRGHQSVDLDMKEGSTVGDAIKASGLSPTGITGVAIFGERVDTHVLLCEGHRVELLQGLQLDPKEARRRRATQARNPAIKPG